MKNRNLKFCMIVLPLYPEVIDAYVYAVNLMEYTDAVSRNLAVYWVMYISLILMGIIRILLLKYSGGRYNKTLCDISIVVSIVIVMLLVLFREVYAAALAFMLLVIKGSILLKRL